MDFESPHVEKEFPGLYASESSRRSNSDYGDSGHERGGKKELLRSKKKERNDKKKDKGYTALGEDSSPDDMEGQDTRNPLKPKKQKSFKFLHKREKEEKEDRKEEKRKEKVERKIDKRKEKVERRKEEGGEKMFKKDKKKKEEQEEEEVPVFGVPLCLAVQRCPAHDGIQLPAIVRECIDQIEEWGLHCEGIYRLSGVKSKAHQLRRLYNTGEAVRLCDQEPHVIASLLKQYLRELPEPVMPSDMMPHFEDVAIIPNPGERAEAMRQLINRLPTANRLLLQYMFKHMGHIIARERDTKMTYQNVSIVLSPTMQISHRVLNVFFLNRAYLFGGVAIKKYIPPIGSSSSGSSGERSLEQLQSVAEIEVEMMKQESRLAHLHTQVTAGQVSRSKEEQLWESTAAPYSTHHHHHHP
ncbi:ralA-binding protein 1-like isoform X2 [Eriocheir sinensis]|uniref:ralA-binding protein 1-like isoform X2 n=1 Tax=Eriocheir sinensis TaxID=95602 RepID=UPI0021C66FAE|nr:ralA-binding protein 1-like isoform X2 [Eriocheir sinensis]